MCHAHYCEQMHLHDKGLPSLALNDRCIHQQHWHSIARTLTDLSDELEHQEQLSPVLPFPSCPTHKLKVWETPPAYNVKVRTVLSRLVG